MTVYTPPLRDIRFLLDEVAGLGAIAALPGFEECSPELVDGILAEAAKIAGNTLAPLNRIGDLEGCRLEDGVARTPTGWGEAWNVLVEGGWIGLPFDPAHGGMGLPNLLNMAVHEMWQSANMAFTLNATLVQGAAHAIELFGSDAQKTLYLPKLITGEWTGTMDITEPQAGSDMAAIRTRAVPDGKGFRISGQKIFISYGDHQLAENIIHLVLARTPDAPPGLKGLSLFVVPKMLEDGSANDVSCVSLEHKLGIRGAPAAVLSFGDKGGAWGTLVGEPNCGVEYMFAMMNHARQAVALQGLAIAERAYQQALNYARERVQGKPAGCTGPAPILHHPDVRRMLMGMKARIEAMRGIVYWAAAALDVAHAHSGAEERAQAHRLVELLTPIAKGWCTETGQQVASVGVQVHGGMGYVEETGAAQHLRDARITTIYEGTTAIQANDLVFRKVVRDRGAALHALLADITHSAEDLRSGADPSLRVVGGALREAASQVARVVPWLVAAAGADLRQAAAGAVPFLEMMGILVGGHCLANAARAAMKIQAENAEVDPFLAAKPITARFYAEHVLPQVHALAAAILFGASSVMALDDEHF